MSKYINPWDTVPELPRLLEDGPRILIVDKKGRWKINTHGIYNMNPLATGYNADPLRNGEKKEYNYGRWVKVYEANRN